MPLANRKPHLNIAASPAFRESVAGRRYVEPRYLTSDLVLLVDSGLAPALDYLSFSTLSAFA